jgi:hypothetical protein
MMRAAESLIAAAPRGATLVEVGVEAWNHDAATLYRQLGYRASSVKRGGNGAVIVLPRRSIAELQASS